MGFGVSEDINKLKIEAINLLHENLTEVDSVFNMMFDYFKNDQMYIDGKKIESIVELKKAYELDIENVVFKIENDKNIPSHFLNFIIRKSRNNLDNLRNFHKEIYAGDFKYESWLELIVLIDTDIADISIHLDNLNLVKEFNKYKNKSEKLINELKISRDELTHKIAQVDTIKDDLKNKKVHEIFEDDSEKFKKLARKYEIAFYLSLVFLFLYFFGWYIEVDTLFLKFKFAEQFHGNYSATFYVQKISLLILSTTLAAFLLKRSFMNRRLADEAYRTAKELDALPRYMEGMPDEMKEKIRFDLAYKYFGNGIHHDSYTGGENLMHENIKANTEFMKVVKGVPSTTDENKADKDKNE